MDPILACSEYKFLFYHVDRNLFLDFEDIKSIIEKIKGRPFVFLRVNWFGFIDKNYTLIDKYVKESGGYIIEDNAHAFFSVFNRNNRTTDAAIYSLHKMFPFQMGGMIRIYNPDLETLIYEKCKDYIDPMYDFTSYDFGAISEKCRRNYFELQSLTAKYEEIFTVLRKLDQNDAVVPQSFPIILQKGDRYKVYLKMNEAGYGVISLYHTMIPQLQRPEYADAAYVSSRILNLPVHQDVNDLLYSEMLEMLLKTVIATDKGM